MKKLITLAIVFSTLSLSGCAIDESTQHKLGAALTNFSQGMKGISDRQDREVNSLQNNKLSTRTECYNTYNGLVCNTF